MVNHYTDLWDQKEVVSMMKKMHDNLSIYPLHIGTQITKQKKNSIFIYMTIYETVLFFYDLRNMV